MLYDVPENWEDQLYDAGLLDEYEYFKSVGFDHEEAYIETITKFGGKERA